MLIFLYVDFFAQGFNYVLLVLNNGFSGIAFGLPEMFTLNQTT